MSSLTAAGCCRAPRRSGRTPSPGKVFDTFLNGDYANPVIVVDEIDKASGDGQYDPLGALYELLEIETATRFVDEFVEAADRRLGRAVARHRRTTPRAFPSRCSAAWRSTRSTRPDAEGAARIAGADLSRESAARMTGGRQFPRRCRPPALEQLAGPAAARDAPRHHSAFGAAKVAGRSEVGADDIQDPRARRQRSGSSPA
jgi:ATP-dependent Lon protease